MYVYSQDYNLTVFLSLTILVCNITDQIFMKCAKSLPAFCDVMDKVIVTLPLFLPVVFIFIPWMFFLQGDDFSRAGMFLKVVVNIADGKFFFTIIS